jgi:hypothetical protein
MPPPCGGFFVSELNRPENTAQVAELLMSVADPGLTHVVFDAPNGELVVRGHHIGRDATGNPQPFVVTEVYRGMPGVAVDNRIQYFSVTPGDCTANDCLPPAAHLVSASGKSLIEAFDLTTATGKGADAEWLRARILAHGAIVAGRLSERSLSASQVFVRLPDPVGPCAGREPVSCGAGQVPTYQRDVNRCLGFAGCSAPGSCLMHLPVCRAGYTLHSWAAGSPACPTYACDPTFLSTE